MDFSEDVLADKWRFRILAILDDFSGLSPRILVQTSVLWRRVTDFIHRISWFYGRPQRICVDKGPEFTLPNFIAGFRDEGLNRHWFLNLQDVQEKIEDWRKFYNQESLMAV